MKDLILPILVVVVALLVFNRQPETKYAASDVVLTAPVPPNVVQGIIAKVQMLKPDYAPIDTVFINRQTDGSYAARILFFNTKKFFGAQFDITARVATDGTIEILDIGASTQVDSGTGYKQDKYREWKDVQDNLEYQFKGALATVPQMSLTNIPVAYQEGMIMDQSNLMTRA
jgi:hypothetical protein